MAGVGGKVDRPDSFMCPSCAIGILNYVRTFASGNFKYRVRKCDLCNNSYLEKSELILTPIPKDQNEIQKETSEERNPKNADVGRDNTGTT
jgi:hypothetical protein|tara:strand:+ start:1817 stop:2089 length:273 start_codon:yes stop_codon:yes gene_type:complete